MKIQYLAILFILIIVPISIVLSSYIGNQIDAINLQTAYDSNLTNATYDAVKAFQLNTTNNKYSSISDSKIRDIEASVNTFYNSLNTSMSDYSIYAEDLKHYVPAILFTLYDGYYIYTSYDNVYSVEEGKNDEDDKIKITLDGKNYQNGLKPYVYYSAKYQLSNGNIIVVNYTLDNEITIYGDVGDGNGYVTKSGYLINPEYIDKNKINYNTKTLIYGKDGNEITIKPEKLEEHLVTIEERANGSTGTDSGDYNYIFYQNKKIYQETNQQVIQKIGSEYFWYDNYIKTPVNDPDIKAYLDSTKKYSQDGKTIMSTSAFDYYNEAYIFSNWVKENLGSITQSKLIRSDNNQLLNDNKEYLSEDTANTKIFDVNSDNDPMLSGSAFNNHRLAIIRKTIETSLNTVISNYHSTQLYDYAMPVLSDDDWYRITSNVSMVTFMQGMTIGYRYYNNYSIITNNINKEVVKPENIYIITEDKTGNGNNREYHQPGCKELLTGIKEGKLEIVGAYPTASFQRQSVRVSENSEDDVHFYLQSRGIQTGGGDMNNLITITGCYNCIVSATGNYNANNIIGGNHLYDFQDSPENGNKNATPAFKNDSIEYKAVRTAYLTALARERFDLYKSNFDLSDLS